MELRVWWVKGVRQRVHILGVTVVTSKRSQHLATKSVSGSVVCSKKGFTALCKLICKFRFGSTNTS